MSQRALLVGGGGHCRSVLDVIEAAGGYRPVGIVDLPDTVGATLCGLPVVGCDADLPSLTGDADVFVLTIGQTTSADARQRLGQELVRIGAKTPSIVSPRAHVAATATLAPGCVVMHGALVNAGATIGAFAIVNSGSIVEHDVTVGDYCHIATAAVVNGGVTVGARVLVGSNAVVREGVAIADDAVIGAGAIVVGDVPPGACIVGVHR